MNNRNLSIKFDCYKQSAYTISVLDFLTTWTEFTVPLISNVSESVTTSSATIIWKTDTNSNSSVEYGNSVLLGSVIINSELVNSHSLTIPSLSSNSVYYYKYIPLYKKGRYMIFSHQHLKQISNLYLHILVNNFEHH